ncbi:MAG TPA: PadR family transcriptional regulator [Thermoleophilaceae bacterium]|nr:PadR family transcriptional regulator [Thermoleophilaceae bacterium]
MRLKPGSYLILGMLQRGVRTGYAIKRTVDRSTSFFWAASLAQVYPDLAALEEGGYVVSADEPRGRRPRKAYRLTDRGDEALAEWLRSERQPHFEWRDEELLRLFFADAVPLEDALELVVRARERAEEAARTFRSDVLPLAQAAAGRFPSIVAREGADYFTWRADWFRGIETELRRALASAAPSASNAAP